MKELSIEQKARAYDEAIGRANDILKGYNPKEGSKATINYIFPELAESEDERIRKELLEHCKNQAKPYIQTGNKCPQIQSWIDWLENQGSNLVKNGYTNNKDIIEYAGNYSREIWHKLMDNFKNIKDYHIGCNDVSDIVLNSIIDVYNWFKKQNEQKEYTFKSIPRLLDMIEPNDRAKAYCQKLIDTLAKEGYNTDAKIVEEVLKGWNGEDIPMAVMDEQKPTDKPEPKFKVGDWIVYNDNVYQIHNIGLKKYYECLRTNGTVHIFDFEYIDSKSHLWTIQDAKDGDVLATDSWLYIFKYTNNEATIQFHCTCPINGRPYKWCFSSDNSYLDIYVDANIHPATKEQRELLFQKIKEAGYEWGAKNKELNIDEGKSEMDYCFTKMMNGEKVTPAWSEEDELQMQGIIDLLPGLTIRHNWLKSLKDRVQPQPKQEWTDEDENNINSIVSRLEVDISYWESRSKTRTNEDEKLINWLKYIKERITCNTIETKEVDLENLFQALPEKIADEKSHQVYELSIYHYNGQCVVDYVGEIDHDSLYVFSGNTLYEAIEKAWIWLKENAKGG